MYLEVCHDNFKLSDLRVDDSLMDRSDAASTFPTPTRQENRGGDRMSLGKYEYESGHAPRMFALVRGRTSGVVWRLDAEVAGRSSAAVRRGSPDARGTAERGHGRARLASAPRRAASYGDADFP